MKYKRQGFTILENIISLSIIGLISSLVVSVFSTSVFYLEKSYESNEMINIGKNKLYETEYLIENSAEEVKSKNYYEKISGYSVNCNIKENDKYYKCYDIKVLVNHGDKKIELNSYVVRI